MIPPVKVKTPPSTRSETAWSRTSPEERHAACRGLCPTLPLRTMDLKPSAAFLPRCLSQSRGLRGPGGPTGECAPTLTFGLFRTFSLSLVPPSLPLLVWCCFLVPQVLRTKLPFNACAPRVGVRGGGRGPTQPFGFSTVQGPLALGDCALRAAGCPSPALAKPPVCLPAPRCTIPPRLALRPCWRPPLRPLAELAPVKICKTSSTEFPSASGIWRSVAERRAGTRPGFQQVAPVSATHVSHLVPTLLPNGRLFHPNGVHPVTLPYGAETDQGRHRHSKGQRQIGRVCSDWPEPPSS